MEQHKDGDIIVENGSGVDSIGIAIDTNNEIDDDSPLLPTVVCEVFKSFVSVIFEEISSPPIDDALSPPPSTTLPVAIPPILLATHQLKRTWALWYLSADRNKSWEARLVQICKFNTVEDFWAYVLIVIMDKHRFIF